jgi:CHAT domain-containing protein
MIFLPDLYFERGRTCILLGDDEAAAKAFDAAITLIESQRDEIPAGELRTGIFDNAAGLFEEAIRLSLRHGDAARAFAYAERSRARGLLDRLSPSNASSLLPMTLENAVLLEFVVLPEEVVRFSIDANGLQVREIRIQASDLERKVAQWLRTTRDPAVVGSPLSQQLFEILFGRDLAPPGVPVIVVADKFLQRLPWAALSDPTSGRYLIEDHRLLIAPSAAMLFASDSRFPTATAIRRGDVLIVRNPAFDRSRFPALPTLRGSEKEADAIRAMYGRGEVLSGAAATRSRFVTEARRFQVIHFAGHAVANESRVSNSFLLFAPDPKKVDDSGALYAPEITNIALPRTTLVVLAACSTLTGDTKGAEGMPSLARSFLASGAVAVIGTLWNIDDSDSARLFSALHRRLAGGASPADALAEAQLEFIHGSDRVLRHPSVWAGVELVASSFSSVHTIVPHARRRTP